MHKGSRIVLVCSARLPTVLQPLESHTLGSRQVTPLTRSRLQPRAQQAQRVLHLLRSLHRELRPLRLVQRLAHRPHLRLLHRVLDLRLVRQCVTRLTMEV